LFQVVFHAQIAREAGEFDVSDVIEQTVSKMVRRHPHVFGRTPPGTPSGQPPEHPEHDDTISPTGTASGPSDLPSAHDVLRRWEALKRQEDGAKHRDSVVDGVPRSLPALLRAHQVQAKASRVGFDWREIGPVAEKVEEEWRELTTEMAGPSRQRQEDELGDLLFAVVNLARFMRINPEEALHRAIRRFAARFRRVEEKAREQGRPLSTERADQAPWTFEELDRLWEQAKREEKA
jgi:tetrapyrrole methylase family protein / MazG family protein